MLTFETMKFPFLILLSAALAVPASAQNPVKMVPVKNVDPTIQFQEFEGWGVSLAWWAHVVGQFPEPARTDYLEKTFDVKKGLGLNFVRYNIGGGENPLYAAPGKNFLEFRTAVPGYLRADGTYDWNADAAQRTVLQYALGHGANRTEAFSNSPPYWMTQSGSVTGNYEGKDNIKPEFDAAFANYLATVTKHFRDEWGVKFDTLEPLNEPDGHWWKFGNHQEGAFVEPPHQNEIIKQTAQAVKNLDLNTSIAASDDSVIDDAVRTFAQYDAQTLATLSRINTHTYGGSARAQLSTLVLSADKPLWMTEYGDGDASGMQMARQINADIRGLHPVAWAYWQVVDNVDGWGFLKNPLTDITKPQYEINRKFYVMGQFSRFIRPDAKFIAVDNRDTLAAFDAQKGILTLVVTNSTDADMPVNYDLSIFSQYGATARVIRTSPTQNNAEIAATKIYRDILTTVNSPQSVTTYVVTGVKFDGQLGFDPQRFYTLTNPLTNRVLQARTDSLTEPQTVITGARATSKRAQWRIVGLGGGKYQLFNRANGLALDVTEASLQSGASVAIYPDKADEPGQSNQQWKIQSGPNETFQLVNTLSGLKLSSPNGIDAPVTQSAPANGQNWRIALVK